MQPSPIINIVNISINCKRSHCTKLRSSFKLRFSQKIGLRNSAWSCDSIAKDNQLKEIDITTAEQDNERDNSNDSVENHENDTYENSNDALCKDEHYPVEAIADYQLNHNDSIILRLGIISDIFIARFIDTIGFFAISFSFITLVPYHNVIQTQYYWYELISPGIFSLCYSYVCLFLHQASHIFDDHAPSDSKIVLLLFFSTATIFTLDHVTIYLIWVVIHRCHLLA